VRALARAPAAAGATYFHFPAWVEICRRRTDVAIPFDLKRSYFDALARLPALVAEAAAREWDSELLTSALGAIAAVKGSVDVAEAVLDLDQDAASDFLRQRFGE
jgi:hypothetical protein